jgi:hypothetical protein
MRIIPPTRFVLLKPPLELLQGLSVRCQLPAEIEGEPLELRPQSVELAAKVGGLREGSISVMSELDHPGADAVDALTTGVADHVPRSP